MLITKMAGRVTLLLLCLQLLWGFTLQQQLRQDGICASLIIPQGDYSCQEHVAQTDDGFLLGVQRMAAANGGGNKKPVFLMHGVLSGGDSWLLNPPSQSLGFILADAGYDVWIGNFRASDFSHGHVSYTKKNKEYWDWSLDELAEKDLVAMVDLAYTVTATPLHYIGYSQGTQAAFAALSEGRLSGQLDKLVMIAPVAYVTHASNPLGLVGAKLQLDQLLSLIKLNFFSTKTSGRQLVDWICAASSTRCFNTWATIFTGQNCCINDSRRPFYDKYETQATSTKNLHHFAQMIRKESFAKYDYGPMENFRRYGSMKPPQYDLSKVPSSKMMLIHGKNDALADIHDVMDLCDQLPQGYQTLYVEEYAHIDFIVGYNANVRVYNDILRFLEV